MEFMDVVKARRSVRSYADIDVEEEKLNLMFEAARLAPSWANKQCWSYVLVYDKEEEIKFNPQTHDDELIYKQNSIGLYNAVILQFSENTSTRRFRMFKWCFKVLHPVCS